MRKFLAVMLALALIVSLTACGGNSNNSGASTSSTPSSQTEQTPASQSPSESDPGSQNEPVPEADPASEEAPDADSEQEEPAGSNILVAYFSRVGNTDWADGVDVVSSASLNLANGEYIGNAQYLAQMAQGATDGDLFLIQSEKTYPSDYRETTDVAAVEQRNNERPVLASHVENMEQYDTIVLVYPNWWGTLPPPLETFLEEYDFSGKTILPICTHEGSGLSNTKSDIAALVPGATVLDGLAVRGSSTPSAQGTVVDFIGGSGILD